MQNVCVQILFVLYDNLNHIQLRTMSVENIFACLILIAAKAKKNFKLQKFPRSRYTRIELHVPSATMEIIVTKWIGTESCPLAAKVYSCALYDI